MRKASIVSLPLLIIVGFGLVVVTVLARIDESLEPLPLDES
jgi:hypothetical protein